MHDSSIFDFFARLVTRRGHFQSFAHLREFPFPRGMIAAEPANRFPDLVLKAHQNGDVEGGEFISYLDSDSYEIPSFGSIPPTATKPVTGLSEDIIETLKYVDEDGAFHDYFEFPDPLPERDIYYLVRGRKRTKFRALHKVVLVSGAFFDTLATDRVLTSAVSQVLSETTQTKPATQRATENLVVQQSDFETLRRVEGSAISIRFEPEFNAVPDVNVLCDDRFPMIADNTLTLLVPENGLPSNTGTTEQYWWYDAPPMITSSGSFIRLKSAYGSWDPDLRWFTKLSILRHPFVGFFFMAQVTLRTSSMEDPESCPCKLWSQG